jgi:hypothetical protein
MIFHHLEVTSDRAVPLLDEPGRYLSALLTVEGTAVRYRLDGAAPTPEIGHRLEPGTHRLPGGPPLGRCQLIAVAGTATVFVTLG